MPFFSHELSGKASTRAPASNKVITHRSHGEVSPVEQDTILCIQYNLDLVTLLVSAKTVTKLHNVTKSNDFM